MRAIIKTGFCVSYDWQYLKYSLPRVYAASDQICLALDKNRKSWKGEQYEFDDEAFYGFVEEIDTAKKIIIYEDDFSLQELDARQNCNRQRMLIADKQGKGGWHIQIDVDEYFLDFEAAVKFLKDLNPCPSGNEKPYNVLANYVPLFKKLEHGYLFVDFEGELSEMAPFATTRPNYERARHNGFFNRLSPFFIIHETWARSEEQLWFKLNNWGHAAEELDGEVKRRAYFENWKRLNKDNFEEAINIHPLVPNIWPSLGYCEGKDQEELIRNFKIPDFPMDNFSLWLRNNRNLARLRHYWSKLVS